MIGRNRIEVWGQLTRAPEFLGDRTKCLLRLEVDGNVGPGEPDAVPCELTLRCRDRAAEQAVYLGEGVFVAVLGHFELVERPEGGTALIQVADHIVELLQLPSAVYCVNREAQGVRA